MYVITHVNPWSWAKVSALLAATCTLLSIPLTLVSSGILFSSSFFSSPIGVGTLIMFIVSILSGMGVGALAAVIYNWLAPYIGFIAMDIELEAEIPEEPVQPSEIQNIAPPPPPPVV